MAIHHQCTCGSRFTLPDTAIGKKARCRSCGSISTVVSDDAAEPATLSYATSHTETGKGDNELLAQPQSFMGDVAYSFMLPFIRGNPGTFLTLAIISVVVLLLPVLNIRLDLLLSAYFAAICLETITHTASGENDFPNVLVHNWWDDLLLPSVQFCGSWLIVLAPAILLKLAAEWGYGFASDRTIYLVGIAGLILWPATVLAIAIGGSLGAARPDIVVRTALAAPHAYLMVCLGVALAGAATFLPGRNPSWATPTRPAMIIVFHLIEPTLSVYALLVASRIVGLYYLHFKNRFPWQAE